MLMKETTDISDMTFDELTNALQHITDNELIDMTILWEEYLRRNSDTLNEANRFEAFLKLNILYTNMSERELWQEYYMNGGL